MNALIIAAHGSRFPAANEEIAQVAERLRAFDGLFDWVGHGFLEMAQPSIGAAIETAIERGARHVVVLPYFLAAGRHVTQDIPDIVHNARQHHPAVTITCAPHAGASAQMPALILGLANRCVEEDFNT